MMITNFCPDHIWPMVPEAIDKVRAFEKINATLEQTEIATRHLIHAGMYARTITIPAGTVLTGALIKRATVLIVNGDVAVNCGEDANRVTGYHVIPASANRKQVFLAFTDTQLTMIFSTGAQDVRQAEEEFTDEADLLFSRKGENFVTITGDPP